MLIFFDMSDLAQHARCVRLRLVLAGRPLVTACHTRIAFRQVLKMVFERKAQHVQLRETHCLRQDVYVYIQLFTQCCSRSTVVRVTQWEDCGAHIRCTGEGHSAKERLHVRRVVLSVYRGVPPLAVASAVPAALWRVYRRTPARVSRLTGAYREYGSR